MLRLQSRKTLYLDGGRLLGAPTDWRILCTHYSFNFGSAAAVDRKLLRFADARNGFSFAGSPKGEEGGKLRKQRLRAESAPGEEALRTPVARGERARRGGADRFACWLIYHAARARLRRDCAHVIRNATFWVYLLRSKVRSMSAAFGMCLSHLDNGLS